MAKVLPSEPNPTLRATAVAEMSCRLQQSILESIPPHTSDPVLRCGFVHCCGSPFQDELAKCVRASGGDLQIVRTALELSISQTKGFRSCCASFVAARHSHKNKPIKRNAAEETEISNTLLEEWLHCAATECTTLENLPTPQIPLDTDLPSTDHSFSSLGQILIDATQSFTREDEGYERGMCSLAVCSVMWSADTADGLDYPSQDAMVVDHRVAEAFRLHGNGARIRLENL